MNVKGIVIRITPYREHGAMLNVLTSEKLLSFYARNIYKVDSQNTLLTSPLLYGEFTFIDQNKPILTYKEVSPIIDTRIYLNDFNKLAVLNFLNEVTLRLCAEEDMPKLYLYLVNALTTLKNVKNPIPIALAYLASALKISGNSLNVDSCVITGSKLNIVGVSYVDGGLISKNVYRSSRHKLYSSVKINILRKIFKFKPEDFLNLNLPIKESFEVLDDLLIFTYDQTGIRFTSEKLLNKVV